VNKQHKLAYQAIKEVSKNHHGAITLLLGIVGVTRQAYAKFWKQDRSIKDSRDTFLKERIMYWYILNTKTIGAGTILTNLEMDETVSFPVTIKQVKRLMRQLDIRCQSRIKKHDRTKQSEIYIQDNILNQEFEVDYPNTVWLSDSTELTYGVNGQHKVRFSGVLDLYGRYLIASNLSSTETSKAEIQVFQRAFNKVGNVHPLVHTDRGSAYTSNAFNNFLSQHDIIRSMSRPGTPYDNSPMERWWSEFKLRWMNRHPTPKTYDELVKLVEEGINYFNNISRSHTRNGHTPAEHWNMAI